MDIAIADQTKAFLLAAALGLCIGLLYDGFRCVRIALRAGKALTAVLDIAFCLCTMAALLVFVLTVCRGVMRGYIWIGAGLGLLLYFNGFSYVIMGVLRPLIKLIRRANKALFCFLRKILGVVAKIFDFPRGN